MTTTNLPLLVGTLIVELDKLLDPDADSTMVSALAERLAVVWLFHQVDPGPIERRLAQAAVFGYLAGKAVPKGEPF